MRNAFLIVLIALLLIPVTATVVTDNSSAGRTVIGAQPAAEAGTTMDSHIVTETAETHIVTERPEVPPVCSGGAAPTDPDRDGQYEDLDGDGTFDIFDVQCFLDTFGRSVLNIEAFDFRDDGRVNIFDVQALLNEVTGSSTPTPTPTPTPDDPTRQVTVTRVVDGDTLKIAYPNGTADTVRLLGVDTPEVHTETDPSEFEGVPNTAAGRDCLRTEGEDASAFVRDRLDSESVTLRFDDAADRRGYYGRLLAYVIHDGTNINYRLVADGYGRVYDSTFTQSDRFYDAERDAQRAQRGLWRCRDVGTATPTPTPPDDGGTTQVAIATIHEDAAGDEYENLNDEYIVIENTGDAAVDLSGWSITEGDDRRYTFPDGFELQPGATVTVHTGSGTDTATDLYWGSDSPLWNNGGDTGTLYDADDEVVDQLEYS